MSDNLNELYEKFVDEATFLRFSRALLEARRKAMRLEDANPSSPYGPDAGGWENVSIAEFLEGAISWAEDSNLGRRMAVEELELKDVSPWRRIAAFIMAGRVYE
jgi:hypothetical protein